MTDGYARWHLGLMSLTWGVVGLVLCAAASANPVVPTASGVQALVADDFRPPFDNLPINADFVKAHKIRKIAVHRDRVLKDETIADFRVKVFEFDDKGNLLTLTEYDRGELFRRTTHSYRAGLRVRSEGVQQDKPNHLRTMSYDKKGRLVHELIEGGWTPEKKYVYGPQGRLDKVVMPDGDKALVESIVYDAQGREIRRTHKVEPGKTVGVRERHYDAKGRTQVWTTTGYRPVPDTFRFSFSKSGALKRLVFIEGAKEIYRRVYEYDGRGFVTSMRQKAVSAVGDDRVRYEYELEGGVTLHRQPPMKVPRGRHEHSHAEVLQAVLEAFPEAYPDLARITYEGDEQDFFPASIRVFIPEAKLKSLSAEALNVRTCQVKKALRYSCDCESTSQEPAINHAWHSWPDKRVVPLSVILNIGC